MYLSALWLYFTLMRVGVYPNCNLTADQQAKICFLIQAYIFGNLLSSCLLLYYNVFSDIPILSVITNSILQYSPKGLRLLEQSLLRRVHSQTRLASTRTGALSTSIYWYQQPAWSSLRQLLLAVDPYKLVKQLGSPSYLQRLELS